MLTVQQIDRIGLAVANLDDARDFFERVFGAQFGELEDVKAFGFRYIPFTIAGFTLEILCPYDDESLIARFLKKRGPGVHHVSFLVDNLDVALKELSELGIEPAHVQENPPDVVFEGSHWREAFIHPQQAFGVLIHLAERTPA
jgi:methylmalonyl-CoA epimerase